MTLNFGRANETYRVEALESAAKGGQAVRGAWNGSGDGGGSDARQTEGSYDRQSARHALCHRARAFPPISI